MTFGQQILRRRALGRAAPIATRHSLLPLAAAAVWRSARAHAHQQASKRAGERAPALLVAPRLACRGGRVDEDGGQTEGRNRRVP